MLIGVIDTDTREAIFQGDAEEFLAIQDYDEELQEVLNNLESPKVLPRVRLDNFFIMRCRA